VRSKPDRVLALLVVALVGCSTTGRDFDEDSIPKIRPGVSTEKDVRRLFGNPTDLAYSSRGNARWTYRYEETKRHDTGTLSKIARSIAAIFRFRWIPPPLDLSYEETTRYELTVWFDAEGTVSDYEYRRTERPKRRVY
jgi:outer membrane protein assembly factor BamE (lipoprotein component of BamABCDE complex)